MCKCYGIDSALLIRWPEQTNLEALGARSRGVVIRKIAISGGMLTPSARKSILFYVLAFGGDCDAQGMFSFRQVMARSGTKATGEKAPESRHNERDPAVLAGYRRIARATRQGAGYRR